MHFPRTNKARVDTDEGKKFFWHSSFPKAFHQSSDVHSIVTDGSMHLSTIKQNIYSKCIVITETPVQNNSEKTFWSWAAPAFPQGDRTEVNRAWWGCNSQFSEDKAFFGCFLAVCLCSFTILILTQSTNSFFRKNFFTERVLSHWKGLPRWWTHHPWRCPRNEWMWPLMLWLSWQAVKSWTWPWRSFPTWIIPWFYDSMIRRTKTKFSQNCTLENPTNEAKSSVEKKKKISMITQRL